MANAFDRFDNQQQPPYPPAANNSFDQFDKEVETETPEADFLERSMTTLGEAGEDIYSSFAG